MGLTARPVQCIVKLECIDMRPAPETDRPARPPARLGEPLPDDPRTRMPPAAHAAEDRVPPAGHADCAAAGGSPGSYRPPLLRWTSPPAARRWPTARPYGRRRAAPPPSPAGNIS